MLHKVAYLHVLLARLEEHDAHNGVGAEWDGPAVHLNAHAQ